MWMAGEELAEEDQSPTMQVLRALGVMQDATVP